MIIPRSLAPASVPEQIILEFSMPTLLQFLQGEGWCVRPDQHSLFPQIIASLPDVECIIRFGTLARSGTGWSDFTLSAPFIVDSEVSPFIGALWNRKNRFGRVYRINKSLFLEMDVVLEGGVTQTYLQYVLAIWADLIQAFLVHLRDDQNILLRYKRREQAEQRIQILATCTSGKLRIQPIW